MNVLKVKNKMVVWVQNGDKCIGSFPLWSHGEPGTAATCPCPASWDSVMPRITSPEKYQLKIWSTVSTECESLSQHCKVKKSLSGIISWGPYVQPTPGQLKEKEKSHRYNLSSL